MAAIAYAEVDPREITLETPVCPRGLAPLMDDMIVAILEEANAPKTPEVICGCVQERSQLSPRAVSPDYQSWVSDRLVKLARKDRVRVFVQAVDGTAHAVVFASPACAKTLP